MVILGAVITSRTIVQRLSGYEWYALSRVIDDARVMAVARRLYALNQSIQELTTYYENLVVPEKVDASLIHPRFCPFINSFTENGKTVEFTYIRPLEREPSCVIFLARRNDDEEEIVVKFVERYGAEAHNWMADADYAPKLIYHEKLEERFGQGYDNLALVVMGHVQGQTLHERYGDGSLPNGLYEAVENALEHLSKGKFILPDIRRPNLMLLGTPGELDKLDDDRDEGYGKRLRVIDFDWACKEGSGMRYPFHLSKDIRDRSGAKEYAEITKGHQDTMFENL